MFEEVVQGPCHYCKDRKIGCHGKCDKYKDYRKTVDRLATIARAKSPIGKGFYSNKQRRNYEKQKKGLR